MDNPVMTAPHPFVDLAPGIHRQRLVIEGVVPVPLAAPAITEYLAGLSDVLGMRTLLPPVTHLSPTYGWAGWIHWETSGAHFYAWDRPEPFFSVDIYACKPFEDLDAVGYTHRVLRPTALVHRPF
jgi:S-adenosylmethionine decarboxylase